MLLSKSLSLYDILKINDKIISYNMYLFFYSTVIRHKNKYHDFLLSLINYIKITKEEE